MLQNATAVYAGWCAFKDYTDRNGISIVKILKAIQQSLYNHSVKNYIAGGIHMKKIQLWIMVAVIALVLICAGAASAEIIASGDCGAKGDNITWTLDSEGLLSIAGTGAMDSLEASEIFSPTGALWYSHQNEIKWAFISEGVTSIGDYVFFNCDRLTSAVIPDSVTSIGNGVFMGCERLREIEIPDSVTSIGDDVFDCCFNLTSIIIPDSVTSIGERVFSHCDSLVIYCNADSYAEEWAQNNGKGDKVRYLDP